MHNFEHNGTTITLDDRGRFTATAEDGTQFESSSLAGVKKMVEKHATKAFKPFEALLLESYSNTFYAAKVKRIGRGKGHRYSDRDVFYIEDKNGYEAVRYNVLRNTPENLAACGAWVRRAKEITSQIELLENERRNLLSALPWLKPADVVPE